MDFTILAVVLLILLVMPNAANHLQGPMLATASITGFAGISHFTLRIILRKT